ncbi:MAG: deoxyribonuclease IV [Candidatus Kerfeldbacteria bacterium]|nr:deoxyribonuclease IV [Candidatus Kerfeldbacteria bacterium]
MSQIGAHVSAAGGVAKAPSNAHAEGLETFQMFSRSPQSFQCPVLTADMVALFLHNVQQYGFKQYYIHAPYLVNIASASNRLRHGSITMLRQELDRGSRLMVRGVMFHTGSAASQPSRRAALTTAGKSLNQILQGYQGSCLLLLENAAGSGSVLGCSLNELAQLYRSIKPAYRKYVGFCIDTQHAFGSGYDLRTKANVNQFVRQIDQQLGLKKLIVIQANDSKVSFDSKKDRHEHIGQGYIGAAAFGYMLQHPKLKHLDYILETPLAGRSEDIAILKKLR